MLVAYIAEYGSNVVRLVWLNGSIGTVAGNGTAGFAGQGVPAAQALLRGPSSLAYNGLGGILIAVSNLRLRQLARTPVPRLCCTFHLSCVLQDTLNCIIRCIDSSGIITTVAGMPRQCASNGESAEALSALQLRFARVN